MQQRVLFAFTGGDRRESPALYPGAGISLPRGSFPFNARKPRISLAIAFAMWALPDSTTALATKRSSGSGPICSAAHERFRPEGGVRIEAYDGLQWPGRAPRRDKTQTAALTNKGQAVLARFELTTAAPLDESQKLGAVVGALLLGHESSHQRAAGLTTPPGQKQPRVRPQRQMPARTRRQGSPHAMYQTPYSTPAGPSVASARRSPTTIGGKYRVSSKAGRAAPRPEIFESGSVPRLSVVPA